MTELIETTPPVGHIPGAGIEFASVGFVRLIESDQIGPSLPRTAMPGIRLAAPERLLPVAVVGVAVGDLLVTVTDASRSARLGRPMQVVHVAADNTAVVVDDRSLPRSIKVNASFSSGIGYGEAAAAWHVLAAFGIGRCPRCHSPGQHVAFGLVMGEPSAGWVLGGCFVPWLRTDLRCPRCEAEWPLPALGDVFDADDE